MTCGVLLLLALSGLTCVLGDVDYNWKPPKFCNGLDCPQYNVVKTTKDYEERAYVVSQWVTTSEEGKDYRAASSAMFQRLFKYISGANTPGKKVAMTAPVLVKIASSQGSSNNYTMGFYVAPSDAASPPTPTDPQVKLTTLTAHTVYTRSFGGYAGIKQYQEEATKLMAALPADSKVDKSFYFGAGYDSPFRPFDRHNEVWFIAP